MALGRSVDSVWEQDSVEALEMLENGARREASLKGALLGAALRFKISLHH
jgi:hypothetical protein